MSSPLNYNPKLMTGPELQKFRKSYGLLQPEFARRLNIHPITLSRWESGQMEPSPLLDLAIKELERQFKAEGLKPDKANGSLLKQKRGKK